jgi:hypothetical protein
MMEDGEIQETTSEGIGGTSDGTLLEPSNADSRITSKMGTQGPAAPRPIAGGKRDPSMEYHWLGEAFCAYPGSATSNIQSRRTLQNTSACSASPELDYDNKSLALNDGHDPSLEWPGLGESSTATEDLYDIIAPTPSPHIPSQIASNPNLRLLVLRTSILPRVQTLVLLSGHTQLQFGRDVAPSGSDTPRVRLKEMAVSKLHATVFWDAARREWAVVDMGSKHGTFLRLDAAGEEAIQSGAQDFGIRLSPPRIASVPRSLRHLGLLTIGSTTFQIHVHNNGTPCANCSSTGANEIPLFPAIKTKTAVQETQKRSRESTGIDFGHRDPKKALTNLKHSLLQHHNHSPPNPPESSLNHSHYVDRSARRRAFHPGSRIDTPGVPNPAPPVAAPPASPTSEAIPIEPPKPSVPLSDTNIGHRLLVKQGWQPGTSLGLDEGLVAPLEPASTTNRAGLGATRLPESASSNNTKQWKENALQRRWDASQ